MLFLLLIKNSNYKENTNSDKTHKDSRMVGESELGDQLKSLDLDSEDSFSLKIRQLYDNLDAFSPKDVNDLLEQAHESTQTKELEARIDTETEKTIQIIKKSLNTKVFLSIITKQTSLRYIKLLKEHIRKSGVEQSDLESYVDLVDRLINHFSYELDDLEAIISVLIPHIAESDVVSLILIKFYSQFKEQTYSLFEDQLEISTIETKYVTSFKLLALLFQLDPILAAKLFELESLQALLNSVDGRTNSSVIKEGLLLLSSACVNDELRKQISERFLNYLITAVKYSDVEIKTLSALVIVKTWNFTSLTSSDSLRLDNIVDTFLEELNDYSVEGLAYLSIKKSVKIRLRKDSGLIFDLIKQLEDLSNNNHYGILVILANLSTVEEKTEVSELKKHAQKGLDEEIEEDEADIHEFNEDLVERKIISIIFKLEKVSKTTLHQIVIIIHNLSTSKKLNTEVIKQGGLRIVLNSLAKEEEFTEFKILALRSLSSLLITSDPQLVFNNDSPKTALNYLFQLLPIEEVKQQDVFQALLALTNLSILDNGALPESQWEVIDSLLNQDNTLLRRSSIELVSNLMQHKSGLPSLFNFEKPSAKKRYDLVVQYTLLEDVKSQSAAISSLSFGVTIPFIAEELVKDDKLSSNLVSIIKDQSDEEALVERALFVLYHLVFYSEGSDFAESLRSSTKLKDGISIVLRNSKDAETKEIALEIAKLVKFN